MKQNIILLLFLLLPIVSFCQFDKLVKTLNDAIETVEKGNLTLLFINAETGKPVSEASVQIKDIGEYTTNLAGWIAIDPQDDATYTLKFTKNGFIEADYTFDVVAKAIPDNKITVSPEIKSDALRFVLVWGKEPQDLDAHFIKKSNFHLSSKNGLVSSDKTARIDRSDNTSYGPETITVANIDNQSSYAYYVKNYSGKDSPKSMALSKSRAMVQVYENNQLIKTYTVPLEQRGTIWTVFTIENGDIIDKNEVGNNSE